MMPSSTPTAGYPMAPRGYMQAPQVLAGTPFASPGMRIAPPGQQGLPAPRLVSSAGRVSSGGLQLTMPQMGMPMQARVISGGATASLPGQRTIVSGASATRIISSGPLQSMSRPATVISSGMIAPVQSPPSAATAQCGMTQDAYESKHKDDPQLQNLKELRKTSGLQNVPVSEALKSLKSKAIEGKFTREQFMAAYTTLLEEKKLQVLDDAVKNAVFDLFDRDDNGVVDMMELICGASLLCTGSEEDKIHAVFDVFDENGDGVISMDEMFKFLTSVFNVVLTPNVMETINSMGVTVESPEDLASVTALECFKTADLNHDGRLSVEEFKNWFFAPSNDPSFLFSPVRKLLQ